MRVFVWANYFYAIMLKNVNCPAALAKKTRNTFRLK